MPTIQENSRLETAVVCCALAIGMVLGGCGDDEGNAASSSNRPPPRKNSPAVVPALAAKGNIAVYEKVDEALRHKFRESDFIPDASGKVNRDPFRSWILNPARDVSTSFESLATVDVCTDPTINVSWEARQHSVRDLELIGLVKRGRSFAQFTDKGEVNSWILQKGDCVGQEKAIIAEIGVGFVRLSITPPAPAGRPAPPTQIQDISLHPEELEIDSLMVEGNQRFSESE